jgi:hypothetical protein
VLQLTHTVSSQHSNATITPKRLAAAIILQCADNSDTSDLYPPRALGTESIALRVNIPETSLVPLINEQKGEKEAGRDD